MVFIFPNTFKCRTICVRPEIFTKKAKPPWMDIEKESLMLTSLLLCICVRHFFILCHLCFTFILRFPLWTILIISWFPPCSGWPLSSSLLICTDIWNSIINKRRNKVNNYRVVGVMCLFISSDHCLRNNHRTRGHKFLPVTSIIGCLSEGLIGCMLICYSIRAPLGYNVAFTWDCPFSGTFKKSK